MNRRILTIFIGFIGLVTAGFAQPTFTVEDDITANPGDSIEVDITVADFTDLIGGQFSMNYDSNVLNYRRLKNLNGIIPPPFVLGPPNIDEGDLRFTWNDPGSNPQSLPDGSLLYTLVFDVVGDPCDSSVIEFSNDPIRIEILDKDVEDVGMIQEDGIFKIPGQNCMGGGGGGSGDVEIIASREFGANGTTACVSFSVNNFEDIASFQFSLDYDNTVLSNPSPQNFNLPFLEMSSFTLNPNAGKIITGWFDNNTVGVTVPDGTVIFDICFDIVGSSGQFSDIEFVDEPLKIEFADPDVIVPHSTTDGRVTVSGGGGGNGELVLTASEETSPPGSRVCVDISVENFDDVVGFQFSMNFNPAILANGAAENFNLKGLNAGIINVNSTTGVVTIAWTDPDAVGVSVPDGTVLFQLCFDVIGNNGQSSNVNFSNNPVAIEFFTNDEDIDVITDNGRVTVGQAGSELKVTVGDTVLRKDNEGYTRVTVENFTDVESMQFVIMYDPTKISDWSVSNFGIPYLDENDFSEVPAGSGMIRVIWGDDEALPRSLADGGTLFRFHFTPIGDCDEETEVKIIESLPNVPIEFAGPNGTIPYQLMPGTIRISCSTGMPIVINGLNNILPSCPGVCDGEINITPGGGDGVNYNYSWTLNGQPFGGNTGNLTDLCAGTYRVTITSGGETGMFMYILTDPNPIVINDVEVKDETTACGDGVIEVAGSGGTGMLNYIWSNGERTARITNLTAGTYAVTVADDNDCFEIKIFNLDGPGALALEGDEVNDLTCHESHADCDGSIELTLSGGCEPIEFNWEGPNGSTFTGSSLTDLCAGTYTVTITDGNGSQLSRTYTVRQPTPIEIISTTITPDENGDGGVDPIIGGGVPIGDYGYEWTDTNGNVISNERILVDVVAGVYTLCITDGRGCEACYDILVPSAEIGVSFDAEVVIGGTNVSCFGECDGAVTVVVAGGVPPYSVSWSDGGSGMMRSDLCAQAYIVEVTDANGKVGIGSITLTSPAALEVEAVRLRCVSELGGDGSYEANITGGTGPYQITWCNGTNTLNATNLEAGACNVLVVDANGCQAFEEFNVCTDSGGDVCYEGMKIITPNGDNANEFFEITCIDEYPNQLEIFNRFGQIVYEQRDYDNSWRGLHTNGTDLTEGGYMWVLVVELPNGGQRVYKGVVNILR